MADGCAFRLLDKCQVAVGQQALSLLLHPVSERSGQEDPRKGVEHILKSAFSFSLTWMMVRPPLDEKTQAFLGTTSLMRASCHLVGSLSRALRPKSRYTQNHHPPGPLRNDFIIPLKAFLSGEKNCVWDAVPNLPAPETEAVLEGGFFEMRS